MIYEIHGQLNARQSAHDSDLKTHLVRVLRSQGATVLLQENGAVVFRGPWLATSWNVLAPISQGEIDVESYAPDASTVRYRLSLFRVRLWCAIFTLVIFLCWPLAELPFFFVFFATCGMWAWLYGGNWLLTAIRFHAFIGNVVANPVSQKAAGSHVG